MSSSFGTCSSSSNSRRIDNFTIVEAKSEEENQEESRFTPDPS
jgi:hypothetical protein